MADDTYVQSIRYEADVSDISRKLDTVASKQDETDRKTGDATGRMAGSWGKVGKAIGKISMGVGLVGGAAILAAPKILNAGAALEGLDEKANTVFGGSIDQVNKWASENAAAMGLTSSQARDAAVSMADLLKPMGFTADQAAGMSTKMIDLSGALSAWSGGTKSAAEVSDILSAAMLGETDGLKGLGIAISAADVEARLAKNGAEGLTGAALEQAKAIATQQLIMEKSGDAQTAWADGSMDASKKQNAMKAATAGVGESLTRALYPALQGILPVVTAFATWLGENAPVAIATLRTAIGNVSDWFMEHKNVMIGTAIALGAVLVGLFTAWAVGATAAAVATLAAAAPFIAIGAAVAAVAAAVIYAYQNWTGFRNAINTVKNFIVNDLVPAFQQMWAFISNNIIPILKVLVETYIRAVLTYFGFLRDAIMNVVVPAFMLIASTIATVASTVGTVVGKIVGFVTGIPGRIASTVSTLWTGIETGITKAKDWVKDRIDDVVGFATGLPERMAGLFSGMWDGIKEAFRGALNWVIDKWNALEFKIPSVSAFGVTIGGATVGVPDIPRLAAGGLAYAPTLAMVGDNRNARTDPEVIAPLSKLTEMLREAVGGSPFSNGGQVTLIIEGRPFTAMIAEHERSQVAQWRAGMR